MASFEPGIPVEIGTIDRELGKLWESSDDTKTRASLINLVIHSEDPESLADNTAIIAEVAGRHACRAILILANPGASDPRAKAWINAHCHPAGKGGRQMCSEQITFRLDGASAGMLPNIVFSHLDTDLPLCLWWQGDFSEPVDDKLWSWVDRLVYDSASWRDPSHQFRLVRHISSAGNGRTLLCDLNWTRLHTWRHAMAGLFDHPAGHACLGEVRSLRVRCARGARLSALLMLGWFAGRLGWRADANTGGFLTADGDPVAAHIEEDGDENLSLFEVDCRESRFALEAGGQPGFSEGVVRIGGHPEVRQLIPSPRARLAETLLEELGRVGRHPLYTDSLETVMPLIARRPGG
jgi:glucose-6-phosphate dehydrogenase assembly protein OpcA